MISKRKAILYATGAFAVFMLFIATLGLTGFTFVQDLSVPEASITEIVVYQSDGVTLLTNGADLSSLWSWNDAENRFDLTIVVKNTGTTEVTTSLSSSDVPSSWTLSSSGTGVLASGATQTVNVQLSNPSTSGGESTGSWHFTIAT